ncbi:MAG: ATP-binding protein [Candidatus Methylacidiphilales bacterium]|nr:ATP-binding protein [Candidatus Methylacidiphilales bacterium]
MTGTLHALQSLMARSHARADLLLQYSESTGFRLVSCNLMAATLFQTREHSSALPSLALNFLPVEMANYFTEALKHVDRSPQQVMPTFRPQSQPGKVYRSTMYYEERIDDAAPDQRWYWFTFTDSALVDEKDRAALESRKLESIGELASGVAHDFNNLIMGIQANAEAMLSSSGLRPPDRSCLVNIIRACSSGSSLTRSLLGYAKRQPLTMTEFNLVELVSDVARIAGLSFGSQHRITVAPLLALDAAPVRVTGCYSSLSHCLLNLIKNAREAMPDGGAIHILWEPLPTHAKLRVKDTGTGIRPEDLANIGQPFFSTKKQGTGLGLAMVQGILSQHDGTVEIESKVGVGTTVSLIWPRKVPGATKRPDPRRSTDMIMAQTGAVQKPAEAHLAFVIDDDDLVRGGVSGLLEHLGYRVQSFSLAEEALDALTPKSLPRLILVDFHMPGMDGSEFIRQWNSLPDTYKEQETQILLVSGHPPSKFQDFVAQYSQINLGVLQKPFSLETLRKKIVNTKANRSITMRLLPPSSNLGKPPGAGGASGGTGSSGTGSGAISLIPPGSAQGIGSGTGAGKGITAPPPGIGMIRPPSGAGMISGTGSGHAAPLPVPSQINRPRELLVPPRLQVPPSKLGASLPPQPPGVGVPGPGNTPPPPSSIPRVVGTPRPRIIMP